MKHPDHIYLHKMPAQNAPSSDDGGSETPFTASFSAAQNHARAGFLRLFWGLLVGLGAFLNQGCSEFLSPDISGKSIQINSPADSLYTADNVISFWWEKDPDIEKYQLQVTTAGSGNLTLLVDTTLATNTIIFTIPPDNAYQWQIRGVNEGSETPWVTRSFFIDQTAPDKATALHLDGDTITVGNADTLRWSSADIPLAGITYAVADSLLLYRKNDSITLGSRIYFSPSDPKRQIITSTSPSPLNGPGKYYWRIVSIDLAGNRKTSDQFQFIVQ